MAAFLLDANVLIALAWPTHIFHEQASRWFAARDHVGWATCPFTQAAFVRILSQPAFSKNCLTPENALLLLEANLAHPKHQFWASDISLPQAIRNLDLRLTGHGQVVDAYLLGLAAHRKGKLATFDKAVATLGEAGGRIIELVA